MGVGFIGLGRMGRGMAHNLLRGAGSLTIFDQSAGAMEALVGEGAVAARSIAALAGSVDTVFLSLPGPAEVEAVLMGPGGVLESGRPGLTVFDLSTNALDVVKRLNRAAADKGVVFLDAPVSGGPAGAASRELVVWVGGDEAVYAANLPHLEALAKFPRHVGGIGAGTVTKLAHNALGYTIMLAQAEAFSVAVKAGMDPLDLWQALQLGMVGRGSPLNMLTRQFLPGKFDEPAFALRLAHKDVTLATAMARELGVSTRLISATHADMTDALARGMGDQDSRAYLQLQLERAGVSIAVPEERIRAALDPAG